VATKTALFIKLSFINIIKVVIFPAKFAFYSAAQIIKTLKLIFLSDFSALFMKEIIVKTTLISESLLLENSFINKPFLSPAIVIRPIWQYVIELICHLSILIFTNIQRSILFITFGISVRLTLLN
jgi:hypothetical protein